MTDSSAQLPELLRQLRDRVTPGKGISGVPFEWPDGVSHEDWLAEVARCRAEADQHAWDARLELGRVATELTGEVIDEVQGPFMIGTRETLYGWRETTVSYSVRSEPDGDVAVINFHGGAYWMGGGETSDLLAGPLLTYLHFETGATSLNVDYSLAPEFPYPASLDDALAVIDYVNAEHPDKKIVLMGTSSGANLATTATRVARGEGLRVDGLVLLMPSLKLDQYSEAVLADLEAKAQRDSMLGAAFPGIDLADPIASPANLERWDGGVPVFIAEAEFDEVVRGAPEFVAAVEASGERVHHRVYPATHTIIAPQDELQMFRDISQFIQGV